MAVTIYNQCILNWLDKNGATAASFWTTQDQGAGGAGAYSALAAAAQACSDAAIIGIQLQTTVQLATMPGDGPYCTVFDRAALLARIPATGTPTRQEIVGPKSSIFLPDLVTVDLTNANVLALQSQIEALVGDKSGNPQGPYYRGLRRQARSGL
jgi:hypothetical protein